MHMSTRLKSFKSATDVPINRNDLTVQFKLHRFVERPGSAIRVLIFFISEKKCTLDMKTVLIFFHFGMVTSRVTFKNLDDSTGNSTTLNSHDTIYSLNPDVPKTIIAPHIRHRESKKPEDSNSRYLGDLNLRPCQKPAKCHTLNYTTCMGVKLPYHSTTLDLTDLKKSRKSPGEVTTLPVFAVHSEMLGSNTTILMCLIYA
ncbi:hypothetical protein NQ318_014010 [Aromia moschata]|uniref:Uncharacterized protein n=1 Tax=Aromia moschata TaxID=1265417 RepID=A0AAV8Z0S9_9CUCU|nr:hypothetical protein NQ318_014010 [Aromia moschata]